MNPIRRFLEKLDTNVAHCLDRHLELAIPQQRSISPDHVVKPRLFEVAGYWSHCTCCPLACLDIHRDACNKCQPEDVA